MYIYYGPTRGVGGPTLGPPRLRAGFTSKVLIRVIDTGAQVR